MMLINICFYRYMNDPVKNLPLDCESISNDLERSGNLNRKIWKRGFTIIEVAIVIAIIGTLSAIAVPKYLKYRYEAKIVVAMTDIKMMEKQINLYVVDNGGQLPDSLNDLPTINEPPKDPWGRPYQYLKIDGAGPPEIDINVPQPEVVKGPQADRSPPVIDVSPPEIDVGDAGVIGSAKKNMMDAPVNQDYDLYSMGKDGKTNFSFKAPVSWDDVVRAYEGRYIGLVSEL
jgi:general secretion pathway protein G